jgi:hypothetical protein
MKLSQIQKEIVDTGGARLIRNRKEQHVKGTAWEYDVKHLFEGSKSGWIILDLTTANALKTCYEALSPDNQAKWDLIHVNSLVDFCWKQVSI